MSDHAVIAAALSLALGGAAPVYAQTSADQAQPGADAPRTEAQTAETVLVTGTRLPRPASETGTAVTVIDAARLERHAFLLDALAGAPGLTINQNGAFGGVASVRIRGASTGQTLVLIDSVPVNDPTSPGGGYDFAALDSSQIARVEILRGAQSVLWGSDAIGGVVNIITRQPGQGLGATGFAEAGSFGTFRGGAAVEGADARGSFRLGASAITTDGISKADERDGNTEADGYDAVTLAGRASYELGFGRIGLTARHVRAEAEYDSFGAVTGVQDGDERSETEDASAALNFEADHFGGALETLVQVGWAGIERDNFTNGAFSFGAEGSRVVYRYQGAWVISDRHRLAFGAEREESEANGSEADSGGVFALLELEPLDGLVLTGGVRHDGDDRYGEETTGKFALSWQVTDAVRLRSAAGTGFKAPTIFQTTFFCCGARGPNPDLAAETSAGYDIGLDYALPGGRGVIELVWFDQTVENQIDFSFLDGGYSNIARVESTGVELSARYAFSPAWTLSGAWTWIDAQDGAGRTLVRLPEQSGQVELAYDAGRWGAAASVRHNGEERYGWGQIDAWTRLDASARFAMSDQVELYVRAENLTDEAYQDVFGYGAPGRSGTFGVRLTR